MWKVGSGARLLPPLLGDPGDPGDNRNNSETSIFDNPSITFGHFAGKGPPNNGSRMLQRPCGPLGQLWALRGSFGRLWGSSGRALGRLWETLGELWDVLDTICIYLIHTILKSAFFKGNKRICAPQTPRFGKCPYWVVFSFLFRQKKSKT